MSLSDYYSDENQDYEDDVLPILDETPIKEEILMKIEKATERLARVLHLANYPVNCLCFRTNCCGFAYKNVFHSHQQLEHILEKNFDGRRFRVKARDGTNLDAMFFPYNNEKVMTVEERVKLKQEDPDKNPSPSYLKYPTVIFFNPNA